VSEEGSGVSGGDPTLEQVFAQLSERGQLEWRLAYQQAVILLLRDGG
jgi:hypothetical protein